MAAAAALVHIWLALRCSRIRIRDRVSLGDGGNDLLICRMRAHANFSENAPLFLILLGLVELSASASQWLWAAGLAFILARIAHAFGMERSPRNLFRAGGMFVTMTVLIALAIAAIVISYQSGKPVMIG
jgi:uncharacterized membrane protein YecN with MAPEG domain